MHNELVKKERWVSEAHFLLPPHGVSPLVSASLSALITTWVTFVPCFLWIFIGAPFVEILKSNAKLTSALSAVTAAVLGLIAILVVWLLGETVFSEGVRTPKLDNVGINVCILYCSA
jgi:chromate transporter